MCQSHFIENYYNMKRSLFVALSALLVVLSSCGPRSHADRTRELLVGYFDSLAIDVEIVSLQAVDTIYTEMPQDDSLYNTLLAEAQNLDQKVVQALRDDARTELVELCEKADAARARVLEYKGAYKGDFVGLAYEIIVRCDDYGLKTKTESKWYVVNSEGTSFFVEDAHFQEIASLKKESEEMKDLLRSARGY